MRAAAAAAANDTGPQGLRLDTHHTLHYIEASSAFVAGFMSEISPPSGEPSR
jgi:hypothetical protein